MRRTPDRAFQPAVRGQHAGHHTARHPSDGPFSLVISTQPAATARLPAPARTAGRVSDAVTDACRPSETATSPSETASETRGGAGGTAGGGARPRSPRRAGGRDPDGRGADDRQRVCDPAVDDVRDAPEPVHRQHRLAAQLADVRENADQ